MNEQIKDVAKVLLAEIKPGIKGDEAMRITQALLNLAHAKNVGIAQL